MTILLASLVASVAAMSSKRGTVIFLAGVTLAFAVISRTQTSR